MRSLRHCSHSVGLAQDAGLLSGMLVSVGEAAASRLLTGFDVPDQAKGGAGFQDSMYFTKCIFFCKPAGEGSARARAPLGVCAAYQ